MYTSRENHYKILPEVIMGHLILFATAVFCLACIVTLLGVENKINTDDNQFNDEGELDMSKMVEYSHYHH